MVTARRRVGSVAPQEALMDRESLDDGGSDQAGDRPRFARDVSERDADNEAWEDDDAAAVADDDDLDSMMLDEDSDAPNLVPEGPPRYILAGRIEMLDKIGEGGMGAVWRGHHLKLDRPVAVKVLDETLQLRADGRERFLRQPRAKDRPHEQEDTSSPHPRPENHSPAPTPPREGARVGGLRGRRAAAERLLRLAAAPVRARLGGLR